MFHFYRLYYICNENVLEIEKVLAEKEGTYYILIFLQIKISQAIYFRDRVEKHSRTSLMITCNILSEFLGLHWRGKKKPNLPVQNCRRRINTIKTETWSSVRRNSSGFYFGAVSAFELAWRRQGI